MIAAATQLFMLVTTYIRLEGYGYGNDSDNFGDSPSTFQYVVLLVFINAGRAQLSIE